MIPIVAALLILQPAVQDASDVRLVAAGTGSQTIDWSLDGQWVATTRDHEAATVRMPGGAHRVTAESHSIHPWTAMARVDPSGPGLAYVPAWSASAPGEPVRPIPMPFAVPLAMLGAFLLRRRLSKGP